VSIAVSLDQSRSLFNVHRILPWSRRPESNPSGGDQKQGNRIQHRALTRIET